MPAERPGAGPDVFHLRGCLTLGEHQRWSEGDLQGQLLPGALGSLREGLVQREALRQVGDRFYICRTRHGSLARLLPVRDGLCGSPRLRIVPREQFGLGLHRV